jgi:two-component system, cell cycle response regulator
VGNYRFAEHLRNSVHASLELAVTDPLTKLHNRRYLDNHLSALFEESTLRGLPVSVLLLDIDHFKSINDTYGHDAGDEVLREFANRVRALTRGIDIVARFGGEEVVVLMPDTPLEGAHTVAERIRERIGATPFSIHRGTRTVEITVSIGVAARRAEDGEADALLKRADLALYKAKGDGRDRVVAAAA